MTPAACWCEQPGGVTTVTAGEVFGLGWTLTMAQPKQELVFAPLGGVGEIGMNLSIYGLGDERKRSPGSRSISACRFATEEHLPGIDLIFPDIRYLVEERKNLAGLVLTHAHEDHYGALIDLWPRS